MFTRFTRTLLNRMDYPSTVMAVAGNLCHDLDVVVVLHAAGHISVERLSTYEPSKAFVPNAFVYKGFTYGDVVQTERAGGIVIGWEEQDNTIQVLEVAGFKEGGADNRWVWETRSHDAATIRPLTEPLELNRQRVLGVTDGFNVRDTESVADFTRMARQQLWYQERRLAKAFLAATRMYPEKPFSYADVTHNRATGGFDVVPLIEAVPAAESVLQERCRSSDLRLLYGLPSEYLARELATAIHLRAIADGVEITSGSSVNPVELNRLVPEVIEKGMPPRTHPISVEELAASSEVDLRLVKLVAARLVRVISYSDVLALARALHLNESMFYDRYLGPR